MSNSKLDSSTTAPPVKLQRRTILVLDAAVEFMLDDSKLQLPAK
jgi:hypothetical protein